VVSGAERACRSVISEEVERSAQGSGDGVEGREYWSPLEIVLDGVY
jgi:hypothetical protein